MTTIDPDGYRFAGPAAVMALAAFGWYGVTGASWALWSGAGMGLIAGYVAWFFRDPVRNAPDVPGSAVSAADGRVLDIREIEADGFPNGRALRIAVFMNVFNVHVNRSPLAGTVIRTTHCPGRKLPAGNPLAETDNEHADIDFDTGHGPMRIRQIAGLVARRVVSRVTNGNHVGRGDRIGLIRFGSRVDVLLPAGFVPAVSRGDRVTAGITIIARSAG